MSFKLQGFGQIPSDPEMWCGRWSFQVELDFDFARRMFEFALPHEYLVNLNDLARETIKRIAQSEVGWDFSQNYIYNYWGGALLTNITVEPGNACGLDMDHYDFEMVKNNEPQIYRDKKIPIKYLPHNVDSMFQAVSLLTLWNLWYNHMGLIVEVGS